MRCRRARLVENHGYVRFAFADALKSMALVLNPIVIAEGMDPVYTLPDGTALLIPVTLETLVSEAGWEFAKQVPEVRRFLQVLGTEAVRDHLGENAWVDALDLSIGRAGDPVNVVITDVRFPNEAEYVKDMGGTMLRISRLNVDGTPFDNGLSKDHPSEAHIASLPVDYDLIARTGELAKVFAAVDFIATDGAEVE